MYVQGLDESLKKKARAVMGLWTWARWRRDGEPWLGMSVGDVDVDMGDDVLWGVVGDELFGSRKTTKADLLGQRVVAHPGGGALRVASSWGSATAEASLSWDYHNWEQPSML